MEHWEVSALKGAEVWVKFANAGEQHGTIQDVKTSFASDDREQVINLSVFEVLLDSGKKIESRGNGFSRIQAEDYP